MLHYMKYQHFVALLIAYIIADLSCAAFSRLARYAGALDAPGSQDYKIQKEPVPFVGGFAVLVGFIGALLISLDWNLINSDSLGAFLREERTRVAFAAILGGLAMAVVGFFDDFRPIHAVVKLVALAGLTAILAQLGLIVQLTPWTMVNWLITLLWIVGVISAFNAIDNTDGVAGVSAASAAWWIFMIGWGVSAETAQAGLSFMGIALLGAVLGFLRHNRPPARIYIGNGGAFLLGFIIAVAAVHAKQSVDPTRIIEPVKGAIVPILLLSYPIFDISYTSFLRWKKGIVRTPIEAIVVSGRDHTAHRLTALGIPPWGVVVVIAILNLVSGLGAFMIVRFDPEWTWVGGIVAAHVAMYASFGWVLRNAVDLRSDQARITHVKRPTGTIKTTTGKTKLTVPS